MGIDSIFHALGMSLQVSFIDLILSGDNALVIALACRALPTEQMRRALFIGTAAAIAMRVAFTGAVALLLDLPGLKLVGAVALVAIAVKLVVEDEQADEAPNETRAAADLWSAVVIIVIADFVMSLDNVVALAAATQGSMAYLLFGLVLSVPLLMFGTLLVARLLERVPLLIPAAGVFLGWIAGDIAVTDAWIASGVATQSPALTVAVPLLCAVFVLGESRVIMHERRTRGPLPAPTGFGLHAWLQRAVLPVPDLTPQPVVAAAVPTRVPVIDPTPPTPTVVPVAPDNASASSTGASIAAAAPVMPASSPAAASAVVAPAELPVAEPLVSEPPVAGKTLIADAPTDAALSSTADNAASPRAWYRRRPYSTLLSPAVGVPIIVVVVGVFWARHFTGGLPAPQQLHAYACMGARGGVFYYRHGADYARMTTDRGSVDAYIRGTKIVWSDYDAATRTLGFAPPLDITWEDVRSLKLDGGDFSQVECVGR